VGDLVDLRQRRLRKERTERAYDALLAAVASASSSRHLVSGSGAARPPRHLALVGTVIRFPDGHR
jgi:hypothetical protein